MSSSNCGPSTSSGPQNDVWILFVAGLLLFASLSNGMLWQDEAETAVLARNTLQFGYPKNTDGVNTINPALPTAWGQAWTYHPWFSFYATAFSFILFGVNTLASRLPFALMGWLSIWLTLRLIRRLTGRKDLAGLTAALLTVNVAFLLHMRQCRYYAPSVLFSLWAVWAYLRFLNRRRFSSIELAAALFLLFQSNHGVFLSVFAGLGLHVLISPELKPHRLRAVKLGIAVVAAISPFFLLLQSAQHQGEFSGSHLSRHAQFYFRQINSYLLPITFWLPILLLWRPAFSLLLGEKTTKERRAWSLACCLLAASLLFLIAVPEQRHFRYLIHGIPWILLIQAALLAALYRRWAWAGIVFGLLITLTDFTHSGPYLIGRMIPSLRSDIPAEKAHLRSFQWEFLQELTHPYRGPMEGIVELLQKEGRAGQTVKIPYEEISLVFYVPTMVVEPLSNTADFYKPTFPDWIVLRKDWLSEEFFRSPYFTDIERRYERRVLDAPDIPWQNRPDLGYHRFVTDRNSPRVSVYRKLR